jgi:phosphohistidine phosphatase SixA
MSTSKAAPPDSPERFLVLLRHGIAEDPVAGKKDEDRSLTAEGHARMKEIARGLAHALPRVRVIYSSPLLRAVQTALWVSKAYRSRAAVTTTDVLAPGATKKDFLALVATIQEPRAIFVGHEPILTEFMRALTGLKPSPLELKKGGCYGVRLLEDGTGALEWVLPPRILRRM